MRERIQKNPRTEQVLQSCDAFHQRGLRYALWALGEATTMEILEWRLKDAEPER